MPAKQRWRGLLGATPILSTWSHNEQSLFSLSHACRLTRDVQAPLDEPKLLPTVRIEEEAPKEFAGVESIHPQVVYEPKTTAATAVALHGAVRFMIPYCSSLIPGAACGLRSNN